MNAGGRVAPDSRSVPERVRAGLIANRSVLAHALFAVVAIVVVGWLVPLSDRFGFIVGAVLTALAIATIPLPEGRR